MIKWLIKCLPRRSRASDMDGLKQETVKIFSNEVQRGI